MNPLKQKSYEQINKLFEALIQARILMPHDINIIYNLLNQIQTVLHPHIEKKDRVIYEKLESLARAEMYKRNKGIKKTFFIEKSTNWERKLREFAIEHIKEDEFVPGGI